MALTRFISWELWEVQSADPATCVGISLLLMAVALLAAWCRRGGRCGWNPTIALRYE
jgi:hypothetical protein